VTTPKTTVTSANCGRNRTTTMVSLGRPSRRCLLLLAALGGLALGGCPESSPRPATNGKASQSKTSLTLLVVNIFLLNWMMFL